VREFWVSSGHHLTHRLPPGETGAGGLAVTDALLLAYLARPELVPPEEACDAERALYAALLAAPRRPVSEAEIAALADPDARENWTMMTAFRDRLVAAPTVERAYLDLVRGGVRHLPPLFLDQLTHLILRNALEGCDDPFVLRAAELFFRPQKASVHEGNLLLADAETIEAAAPNGQPSPLLAMFGREPIAQLDILDVGNAWTYWSRSDAFTMALNLGGSPESRAGLARAIEAWTRHLLGVTVAVQPLATLDDPDWRWFVGLDAEATRIGNALWAGQPSPAAREGVIALFRLDFADRADIRPELGAAPVYLILAMTPDRSVRLKPQNLILNLPLSDRRRAA
jgi:hypothetical protein